MASSCAASGVPPMPASTGRDPLARPQALVGAEPAHLGDQPHQRGDLGLGGGVARGRLARPRHRTPCRPARRHHDRVPAGQRRPQLLGDERHHRVQQPQQPVEHVAEHRAGDLRPDRPPAGPSSRPVRPGWPWPAPGTSRRTRPRRSGRAPRRACRTRTPRNSPSTSAVTAASRDRIQRSGGGQARGRGQRVRHAGPVQQREPGGVPQLVAEVPGAGDPLLADRDVAAGVGAAGQGEPRRVGAEPVDPVQRVDGVAARLGHLPAAGVPHQAVQGDGAERHRVGRVPVAIAYRPNIIIRATQKNRMS